MKIEFGEITVEKVGKLYVASTIATSPMRAEVNMSGKTEDIAKQKLKMFLEGEPYSHLDANSQK